ncbi:MAG: acyl-CoA dehydrogenase family protein [Candidatus Rokubacteria bacterium]|nr:acyl-CoA dehydrogenase family protein [Candidatus Rokubacteria bacterium]
MAPPPLDALPPALDAHRERLRTFLAAEIVPAERAARVRDEGEAPADLRRWVRQRSAELGLFRLLQPADIGGGGLGPLAAVALHETIGASGALLGRFTLGGDGGLLRLATGEQRERLLLPVLRGELDAVLAFTDAREGPRTTAVRRGDAFAVSGVKSFVTGGARADLLLAVARVTENAGGPTGTAIFVVRRDAPGVTLRREMRTLDGTAHGEFELREVLVPAADVLGTIGEGLPQALASIATVRLVVAATACGVAQWALEWTLATVTRPHRTGTPLAEREQVQAMIGDSATDLYAARAATWAAGRQAETGADAEREATMAKVLATEAVARVVDRAMQLTGGAAVVEDHPLAIAYRRIRSWRIAEGTTEVLRLTIARGLLGARVKG